MKTSSLCARLSAVLLSLVSLWHIGASSATAGSQESDYDLPLPWTYYQQNPTEGVAYAEDTGSDINGDGIPDTILTSPYYSLAHPEISRVTVISGWDSGPRYLFDSVSLEPNDLYGSSVSALPNFWGDERVALAVGAPLSDVDSMTDAGRVYVYGGQGLERRMVIKGTGAESALGFSLAYIGDVNNDGYGDLALGAPGLSASTVGRVYIYFGRELPPDNSELQLTTNDADVVLTSPDQGDMFGYSIAGQYDLTGDGLADIAVGAPNASIGGLEATGSTYLFRSSDFGLVTRVNGTADQSKSGAAVIISPPIVADGDSRLMIGMPGDALAPLDPQRTPGRVAVFSASSLLASGPVATTLQADATLSAAEQTATLFGAELQLEYAPPGSASPAVLIGYGVIAPATSAVVTGYSLDPSIDWHVVINMTSRYAAPYATESYRFVTEIGSGLDLSHPYTPPTGAPQGDDELSMKHHGDATKDYQINLDDINAILQKLGMTGLGVGDADIDGDGTVTVADLAISMDNQGLSILAAINEDCEQYLIDGIYPEFPTVCDCVNELSSRPPANFMIDWGDLADDPCSGGLPPGGGPNPPPPPPPPPGCDDMPIEFPIDCLDYAECVVEPLDDLVDDIQSELGAAQQQIQDIQADLADAVTELSLATQARAGQYRLAKKEVRDGTHKQTRAIDSNVKLKLAGTAIGAVGGGVVGAIGGSVVPGAGTVAGAVTGGTVGLIFAGSLFAYDVPGLIADKGDIRTARDLAMDAIDAAAEGDPSATQPTMVTQGAVVSVGRWSALVQAGADWRAAFDAVRNLEQDLEQARQELNQALADLEAALDAREDALEDALDGCCEDNFEGELCP